MHHRDHPITFPDPKNPDRTVIGMGLLAVKAKIKETLNSNTRTRGKIIIKFAVFQV